MELTLYLGDYAYSSWSLRGWLLLDAFGVAFQKRYAHMRTPEFEAMRTEMVPSRLVPALKITDQGRDRMVWETMTIAETVAELFPEAGLWPKGAADRALARALAAEMHAGFTALRGACPMNMRRAYAGFEPDAEVLADLERLSAIWAHARANRQGEGAFLLGPFTAADAFYAPIASRIATYGLEMSEADTAYVAAILAHPSIQRWYAMAKQDGHVQAHYEFDYADRANPHDVD